MKNYYLIAGGFALGYGLSKIPTPKNEGDVTGAALYMIGGAVIVLIGVFGFKK